MNYRAEVLEIRKQRKVSVTKLSKLTGIPADRIYKWESGIGNPKADDSEKLQKWLNGSSSENGTTTPQEAKSGDKSELLDIMRERIKELKEDKDYLKRNLEFSLAGLHLGQKSILAHVSTILEKDDERDAAGNKRKEQSLKDETGKRIVDKVAAVSQMDTQSR